MTSVSTDISMEKYQSHCKQLHKEIKKLLAKKVKVYEKLGLSDKTSGNIMLAVIQTIMIEIILSVGNPHDLFDEVIDNMKSRVDGAIIMDTMIMGGDAND